MPGATTATSQQTVELCVDDELDAEIDLSWREYAKKEEGSKVQTSPFGSNLLSLQPLPSLCTHTSTLL